MSGSSSPQDSAPPPSGPSFLSRGNGPQLAYYRVAARPDMAQAPMVLFCGGFRSDMTGTKASFLDALCRERGWGFVRFDYSGHGQSAGRFNDGTIESWIADATAVFDRLTEGPVIVVGSSMGGWIGLWLALTRRDRVAGFVGIAAAPDFTRHMPDLFDDVMRESFAARGFAEVPNGYSDQPYIITRALIESGNRVCLLNHMHDLPIPVRLLQGQLDREVDWHTPEQIRDCLNGADIRIHLVEDGDHSLSRPQDLALLESQIVDIMALRQD